MPIFIRVEKLAKPRLHLFMGDFSVVKYGRKTPMVLPKFLQVILKTSRNFFKRALHRPQNDPSGRPETP